MRIFSFVYTHLQKVEMRIYRSSLPYMHIYAFRICAFMEALFCICTYTQDKNYAHIWKDKCAYIEGKMCIFLSQKYAFCLLYMPFVLAHFIFCICASMTELDSTGERCTLFVQLDMGIMFKGWEWSTVEVYEGGDQGSAANMLMKGGV